MARAATHAAPKRRTAGRPAHQAHRSKTSAHVRTARRAASRSRRAARTAPARPTASTARARSAGAAHARGPAPSQRPRAARPSGAAVLRLPVRSANGLLDRLLRGKAWVACVGALLAGIVFLNVSLLGLNSGIAVTADQAAELRRENADLRLEVAKLGSTERIQRVAESRGFVMPAPGDVDYVQADPESDGRRAAVALERQRPDPVESASVAEPTADVAATPEATDEAVPEAPATPAGAVAPAPPAAAAVPPAPPPGATPAPGSLPE
jgi:cell division protein FtsL